MGKHVKTPSPTPETTLFRYPFDSKSDSDRRLLRLPSHLPTLDAPRKMCHGNNKEAITLIQQPRQRIVPCRERGHQGEEAASLDDWGVGHPGCVGAEVSNSEEQKSEVEEEEKAEKGDGGAEGAEDEKEGEDEPALGKQV